MNPGSRPLVVRLCALLALALGATTLTGWALGITQLVQILPGWTPMVVNTGVGFVVSGVGLFAASLRLRWSETLAAVLGGLLVILALEELAVLVFDISPALSLPELHRPLQPGYPHPGRMAPNTALCFLLFGSGLLATVRSHRPAIFTWIQRVAVAVMAIGMIGVIGYWLQLEYLYDWTGVVRMSVQTGAGMTLLGNGLWNLSDLRTSDTAIVDGKEVEGAYRTAAIVLLMFAAGAGIGGFAFMQGQMESELRQHMLQMSADRALLFDQIIEHRSVRASMVSDESEPGLLLPSLLASPEDAATLQKFRAWAGGLRRNGFSSVSIEAGGRRWQLAGAPANAALAITLRGNYPGWLLWRNGYLLRRVLPLHDAAGEVVGALVTEQSLVALDRESAASNQIGETGEMAVCAAAPDDQIDCFPQRFRSEPFRVARVVDGQPLPMAYAVRSLSGTIITLDYRRQRVLAAYGPIGDTGLGLVVKKDIAEIYAPMRQQFQRIVLFLAALLGFGLWLMRRRLRPLLQTLQDSRALAQAESLRFTAAVESNLDAFFMLECVRDQSGEPTDLRYVMLNARAERFLHMTRAEALGRGMCELFPERRSDGMLARYLHAVETGNPIIEERSAVANNGQTRWYHLQAVRLGDGLGVTVRDITSARHAADTILHQAMHDPLTGLTNRAGFELALAGAIAEALPRNRVTALVMLDLDDFKPINDTLGHAAGDNLLKEVATRLRNCTRPSDTVARLGGDEFVLILPDIRYPLGAEVVARKLIARIAQPIELDGHTLKVTASVGISACPIDSIDAMHLLKCADAAMYRAKHAGRNGFAFFDPSSEASASSP